MAGNIILIGNPVAGGGAAFKIRKASDLLIRRGYDVRLMLTGRKGDGETFARDLSGQPVRMVLAAGGDGTYNEIANGLVHSRIPMAILPLGTTSVLARELDIPLAVKGAIDIALNGDIRTVHLGRITFPESNIKRYFLLMAGIGFDAEATMRVDETLKKFTGKGAYLLSGLKTLLHYNPGGIALSLGSEETDAARLPAISAHCAIIGKASRYGGSFKATPDARLTEPCFYVFITHGRTRRALLRYIAGIVTGRHLGFPDISYLKADRITVEGKAHVQIDGDYAGTTPARIEIERDALRLVVPHPSKQ